MTNSTTIKNDKIDVIVDHCFDSTVYNNKQDEPYDLAYSNHKTKINGNETNLKLFAPASMDIIIKDSALNEKYSSIDGYEQSTEFQSVMQSLLDKMFKREARNAGMIFDQQSFAKNRSNYMFSAVLSSMAIRRYYKVSPVLIEWGHEFIYKNVFGNEMMGTYDLISIIGVCSPYEPMIEFNTGIPHIICYDDRGEEWYKMQVGNTALEIAALWGFKINA